jgi:hypothetical protein
MNVETDLDMCTDRAERATQDCGWMQGAARATAHAVQLWAPLTCAQWNCAALGTARGHRQ